MSGAAASLVERSHRGVAWAAALALPLFTLAEVNYPQLSPQSQLAVFAGLGLALAFLGKRRSPRPWLLALDLALALLALAVFGYVVVQTEPALSGWWSAGQSLGDRAGAETRLDLAVGTVGLVLVLTATRRSLGWALPALALAFLAYGRFGAWLPAALLPHRGYSLERLVGQTFLHSQGVFGVALTVMFSYVFLFVVFGALLEATGATGYIVGAGRRLFGGTVGGPAKVAVFSSGLLGSLSGSAVANTATTGTFTIPMMRSAGFERHLAAGIEAAASSGGALMPPVMGAGAYMMLEIVHPPVTYLEVIRAALLPAVLYYLAIFVTVHFWARRAVLAPPAAPEEGVAEREAGGSLARYEGLVVAVALGSLVALLVVGFTVFRAVTVALAAVVVLSTLHPRTRLTPRRLVEALAGASRGGVALVGAAASVGIVIGVVTLTGAGTRLPAIVLPLAQEHLLAALGVLMVSSLVLGMGLPSAVCYLLLATLVGPVLGRLGVPSLGAHLFIFYFGLMSMVTPPVALAAYAASSIAGSGFLRSSVAAFRFALVGFVLPFMFVYRPELLMLDAGGGPASAVRIAGALAMAAAGVVSLAGAVAGFFRRRLSPAGRALLLVAAALTLFPGRGPFLGEYGLSLLNLGGVALAAWVWLRGGRGGPQSP